jgi:hypothetical protein
MITNVDVELKPLPPGQTWQCRAHGSCRGGRLQCTRSRRGVPLRVAGHSLAPKSCVRRGGAHVGLRSIPSGARQRGTHADDPVCRRLTRARVPGAMSILQQSTRPRRRWRRRRWRAAARPYGQGVLPRIMVVHASDQHDEGAAARCDPLPCLGAAVSPVIVVAQRWSGGQARRVRGGRRRGGGGVDVEHEVGENGAQLVVV